MSAAPEFNEKDRFSPYYINLSEMIYGRNFQSPGGNAFLQRVFDDVKTDRGFKNALDIGFGCGGNSLFLNQHFQCSVTGIDINEVFMEIAPARFREIGDIPIQLLNMSILDLQETESYDLVLCRDVLMYIYDKQKALQNIHNAMIEGGKFILIDYCRRPDPLSDAFAGHVRNGDFHLSTLADYQTLLTHLKFRNLVVQDITPLYVSYMEDALETFDSNPAIYNSFKTNDINYIRKRTISKIGYCTEGSMVWGAMIAEK